MTAKPAHAVLILVLLFGGCSKNREEPSLKGKEPVFEQNIVQSVEDLDEVGLQKLIKERKGKVLFLNVWATWCAPCVEEFPDIVKLARAYGEENVEIIGISIDFPEEVETKILPFLRKQDVPFKVYVADIKDQEKFINGLNPKWSGAIPATFIFDRDGIQKFSLIGQGNYDTFKTELEKIKGAL